jgi:DNA polymerase III gamma/tau subunit
MRDSLSLLDQVIERVRQRTEDADVAEALGTIDRTVVHASRRRW